jgi:Mrp family chromosome partitioning ATPase
MRDYDMTIVDTPPANSCADALRISTVVGFSLIVARKQRTLVSDVRVLADQLKKERARAIGTVMNSY